MGDHDVDDPHRHWFEHGADVALALCVADIARTGMLLERVLDDFQLQNVADVRDIDLAGAGCR